ncbi:CARDB domain-containing protein [Halobaculum halobium]
MKRLVAALALLTLSGALVFPSAAAPFALSQSDAITQDVSLAPTTTPNGDYAYLDENDELVVDLTASNPNLAGEAEGVNPDAVTTLANVFQIHYNGSRYAHVWITDESDAVTFTVDGDPIDSEANNVTLGPNQSVSVGVLVDTTGDGGDGLIDDVQVHAAVAEPEGVDGASTDGGGSVASTDAGGDASEDDADTASSDGGTAVQVFAPSPTERSVTVVNAPTEGRTTVDLNAMPLDGESAADGGQANLTLDSIAVTASNGSTISLELATAELGSEDAVGVSSLGAVEVTEAESGSVSAATVRFSVSRAYLADRGVAPEELTVTRTSTGEASTLPVRIVDAAGERVIFEADTPGFSTFTVAALRPSIGVSEASLSTESIEANESATVTARVGNDGRAPGEKTITLTLDGEAVAERTVELDAGESTTVTFDVTPGTAGEYAVVVDGTAAGILTVGGTESASGAVGTAADSGGETAAAVTATAAPVEEPAGLGLVEVGGLAFVAATVVALLVLARRVPR